LVPPQQGHLCTGHVTERDQIQSIWPSFPPPPTASCGLELPNYGSRESPG
jgi:hypothetical protein